MELSNDGVHRRKVPGPRHGSWQAVGEPPGFVGGSGPSRKRKLLMAMLDAVYVDTVEDKSVVAIRPKPAFRPIFEVATTRAGSGIVLINETPPGPEGPEAESLCSWWRRGRVELYREL